MFSFNLFQLVCSYIFYPFAVIVGIPLSDALQVGSIYGKKIIMTEFLAYIELGEKAKSGLLQVTNFLSLWIHVQGNPLFYGVFAFHFIRGGGGRL